MALYVVPKLRTDATDFLETARKNALDVFDPPTIGHCGDNFFHLCREVSYTLSFLTFFHHHHFLLLVLSLPLFLLLLVVLHIKRKKEIYSQDLFHFGQLKLLFPLSPFV